MIVIGKLIEYAIIKSNLQIIYMSRTTFIKNIQKAYKIAELSQKQGITVDEILEKLSSNLTRRQLLKVGLATASFTAANIYRRENVAAKMKLTPILIVGGGIAGLTAAYRLNQAGVPVEVIEATATVGGRMQTVYNALGTSIPVEIGGEFIDTEHSHLLSLAKELDFKLIDLKSTQKNLTEDTFYINKRKISLKEVTEDFKVIAKQLARDAKATSDVSYKESNAKAKELDHLSILEYLERLKTPETLKTILDVAYNIEFGLESSEQSALNLISLIGEQASSFGAFGGSDEGKDEDKTSGFEPFGDSDERYYIQGGNQQIPQKLANILGDKVSLNTALQEIRRLSDGRYLVTMQSNNSKVVERKYEKVILAIPFSVLRHIPLKVNLSAIKRRAIDSLGYGSNSKLISSYQEKVWQTQYHSTGSIFTDLDFQNTWEVSGNIPLKGVGLLTNFTGGKAGVAVGKKTLKKATEEFANQLEQVFPGVESKQRENTPLLSYWINKKYSLGSYSCYLIGQHTSISGVEGERVDNLFFIGEHTSLDFGGYMEGGCETGNAAAKEILAEI